MGKKKSTCVYKFVNTIFTSFLKVQIDGKHPGREKEKLMEVIG